MKRIRICFPHGHPIERCLHFPKRIVRPPCHVRFSFKLKSRRLIPVSFQHISFIIPDRNLRTGIRVCGNMFIQICAEFLHSTFAMLLRSPWQRVAGHKQQTKRSYADNEILSFGIQTDIFCHILSFQMRHLSVNRRLRLFSPAGTPSPHAVKVTSYTK